MLSHAHLVPVGLGYTSTLKVDNCFLKRYSPIVYVRVCVLFYMSLLQSTKLKSPISLNLSLCNVKVCM